LLVGYVAPVPDTGLPREIHRLNRCSYGAASESGYIYPGCWLYTIAPEWRFREVPFHNRYSRVPNTCTDRRTVWEANKYMTTFSGRLEPDSEYRREVEEAYKQYLQRLKEADELMASVTAETFLERVQAGLDVIPGTHAYERFAGDELEGSLRAAAARMFMRKLRSGELRVS